MSTKTLKDVLDELPTLPEGYRWRLGSASAANMKRIKIQKRGLFGIYYTIEWGVWHTREGLGNMSNAENWWREPGLAGTAGWVLDKFDKRIADAVNKADKRNV